MNKRLYTIFLISIFLLLPGFSTAAERIYNVLFVQSYAPETPWHNDLVRGLKDGFGESGLKVNITTEFLDANFWTYQSEKLIMRRFCERARERGTDLIVTVSDEAFHTLLTCGDSLALQLPVVFFNIKYPEGSLIDSLPNVCGYTANPDFGELLRQASRLFPTRTEVVCISDNSLLSSKGKDDFMNEWEGFVEEHPEYTVTFYNSQTDTTNKIIASTCYPRNTHKTLIIAPKWSSFMSFIGRNSKAPFFSCENLALTNGAFGAYDADSYASAHEVGRTAADVLRGKSPSEVGIIESPLKFMYDFKQLVFFKVDPKQASAIGGTIINEPYMEKYRMLYILLYSSILALLVFLIVWLYRINRRESRRRIHAQTRLLIQNRLVAQRDEFDNVFHSIRDGVITYDTDFRIHFTNRSLLKMLHLPKDEAARPYEGLPAGSIFKIYNNGKEILRPMLKQVVTEESSVVIPENSFMQEVHSGSYFPVSGEVVPIRAHGKITGMALSARNISDEEMQKRFFSMAVDESSIYPWQYNIRTGLFTFPAGFLTRFGFAENKTTISRGEMDRMIHPDDQESAYEIFNRALAGLSQSTRMSFRQLSGDGNYEWWEYRTSVLAGLTTDTPYSILGVCQSIQRYKTTEEELTAARDKALQADKLKSAFLANMSHEIRTPLNAIVGFSELMVYSEDPAEKEEYMSIIQSNNELLLRLINDILDLSKIESGILDRKRETFNLAKVCNKLYTMIQPKITNPDVEFQMDNSGPDCWIFLDRSRLKQVWMNYLTNAVKCTKSGYIKMGYSIEREGIRIYVEDSGVGIPEELQERVFGRFQKLNEFAQGTGLGLAISRAIIEGAGGEVGFTSTPGIGSTFWAWIPCEISTQKEHTPTISLPLQHQLSLNEIDKKELKILIAEDNESNYSLVQHILKSYHLTHVQNGAEAVNKVREEEFDLVLMDMKMPVMGGLEATRKIREFNNRIPIIALTANAFDADRISALDAGCNEFLAKPLKKSLLLELFSKKW